MVGFIWVSIKKTKNMGSEFINGVMAEYSKALGLMENNMALELLKLPNFNQLSKKGFGKMAKE